MQEKTPDFFTAGMPEPITPEQMTILPAILEKEGFQGDIKCTGNEVVLTQSGVATCFNVDLKKRTVQIVLEKSYDLFAEDDQRDTGPRPIKNASQIHEERREMLIEALEMAADESLLEEF